ncbi:tail protein X, partial [Salmonella enterica subsp. enterica]|nr:tail protein X [Salmonella enterica subsp. enterica]
YADPMGYGRIVLANPHVAVTPVLPGGLRLAIPVIDAVDVTEELPPWLR